jgi:hypothetical protein
MVRGLPEGSVNSMAAPVRRRWSRASVLEHTAQGQAMMGTPEEVPVPRNVKRMKRG